MEAPPVGLARRPVVDDPTNDAEHDGDDRWYGAHVERRVFVHDLYREHERADDVENHSPLAIGAPLHRELQRGECLQETANMVAERLGPCPPWDSV